MSTNTGSRTIVFFGLTEKIRAVGDGILSFVNAGFTKIALIGPSSSNLKQLADAVELEASQHSSLSKPEILVLEVDISSVESIGLASHNVRSKVGAWDVFVNCLALTPRKSPKTTIRGADEDEWWEPFERNVRTLHSIARHFFPKKTANAVFFNVVTVDIDRISEEKNSAENASQLAAARIVTHLRKENATDGFQAINARLNENETFSFHKFDAFTTS